MKYPFLISFSGLDGSGKTQLIVLLRQFFRRQGISYLYIHSVKDSFGNKIAEKIPFLKSLAKPETAEGVAATESVTVKKVSGEKAISFFSFFVRIIVLILDALYLRLRMLYWGKNYEVVIFDRYAYDKLIHAVYLRGKKHLGPYFWLARTFPRPNVPIYLHITPEQSMERKREVAAEGQDENYFKIKYRLFTEGAILWRFLVIDNSTMSISEAKKKIISVFKKRYYKRKLKMKN